MSQIHLLSSETINRIAAGEVVERPVNVVKELAENSIDAGATAITVEIKNGGIDLIRVTDNGSGIEPSQVPAAFRRHATSKILDASDLSSLHSLGFRGEALSSIAAVSQVEMITKTRDNLVGVRAVNRSYGAVSADGGAASLQTTDVIPLQITEVGAPDGTSVIVRNLFANVPVRRKFLKTPQTEAGYITDLVEHLALSHPDISFHYRVNNQEKLHTTGNGNIKELIYRIYGREMSNSVIPISAASEEGDLVVNGFLGRPEFSRSSRNYEIFFVNGRILKSDVLSKALEEGYRTDLMQHRFPFAIVYVKIPAELIDVNVHPSKMEVRFSDARRVYDFINESVHRTLHRIELIPRETLDTKAEEAARAKREAAEREQAEAAQVHAEPFERAPVNLRAAAGSKVEPQNIVTSDISKISNNTPGDLLADAATEKIHTYDPAALSFREDNTDRQDDFIFVDKTARHEVYAATAGDEEISSKGLPDAAGIGSARKVKYEQESFIEEQDLPDQKQAAAKDAAREKSVLAGDLEAMFRKSVQDDYAEDIYGNREYHILTADNAKHYKIVGQIFDTYWILEFKDKMLMIDQHAAHEKVNFERLMKRLATEQETPAASQMLAPPIIINLTGREEGAYEMYREYFHRMGYEIEPFGDNSYAIRAVPLELYANEPDALLREILDEILDSKMSGTPAAILYKIASMSCKAAVKGNMHQTLDEARALIDELLSLDNPYHCPHGRPTMIILSKGEIERKFKRIV